LHKYLLDKQSFSYYDVIDKTKGAEQKSAPAIMQKEDRSDLNDKNKCNENA
jgi:hypothetical protein